MKTPDKLKEALLRGTGYYGPEDLIPAAHMQLSVMTIVANIAGDTSTTAAELGITLGVLAAYIDEVSSES